MYSLKRKIPYYNDLYVEEIKNLNNDKVDFFSVILPLHEIRMVRKPVHYYLHKSNGVKNG